MATVYRHTYRKWYIVTTVIQIGNGVLCNHTKNTEYKFSLSLCKLQPMLYVPAVCLIFAESHVFAPLAVSSPSSELSR